ncbi:hypothetical protein POTOM_032044 [Populus tomentosa]|uniref:Splicing factor subunit n=1 Tax=Populus tomentosa TaxID=118781 RepID=A0A8X8CS92_POPTO|nr:hypothetical protein POTOM_032044 [Populus tomentosa]
MQASDRFNINSQLEHLQAKYVGTGHADLNRFEWAVNIQRDSYASYIGHYPMLAYFALAENESIGRERYNFMQDIGDDLHVRSKLCWCYNHIPGNAWGHANYPAVGKPYVLSESGAVIRNASFIENAFALWNIGLLMTVMSTEVIICDCRLVEIMFYGFKDGLSLERLCG